MNLHTDGYESVVHDFSLFNFVFIAFASLPNFMGQGLSITVASLEIGLCGLGISESGHDEFPFNRQ